MLTSQSGGTEPSAFAEEGVSVPLEICSFTAVGSRGSRDAMNVRLLPFAAVAAAIVLGGCSLSEKYSKNQAAGEAWLASAAARPSASHFEGTYYSPDWGLVALNQEGRNLSGSIGHYHLRGKVAGKTAYLLLVDDQWTDYTMVLSRKSAGVLTGSYSAHIPFSKDDAEPILLNQIED